MKFILSSILLVGAFVPSFAANFEICDQRWHPQRKEKGKKRPEGFEGFKTQVKVGCKIKGGGKNKNCLDDDKVKAYVDSFSCCQDFTMKIKYKMMNKSEKAVTDGAFKQTDMMAVTVGKEKSFMRFNGTDIVWAGNTPGVGVVEIGADRNVKLNIKVRTNTCTPGVYEIQDQLMIKSMTNGDGTVLDEERKMKCGITKFVTVPDSNAIDAGLCEGSEGPIGGPVVVIMPPGSGNGPPGGNGNGGNPPSKNGGGRGSKSPTGGKVPPPKTPDPKASKSPSYTKRPSAKGPSAKGPSASKSPSDMKSPGGSKSPSLAKSGSKSPSDGKGSKSPSMSKGKGTDAPGAPVRRRARTLH